MPLTLCDRVLQIWLHLEEGRAEETIGVVTRVATAGIGEAERRGVWLPDGRSKFEQRQNGWQGGPLDHIELDPPANRAKSRLTRDVIPSPPTPHHKQSAAVTLDGGLANSRSVETRNIT